MNRIIISRTDNIGDVVLTLPMAGLIKSLSKDSYIIFLGKKYTAPVIALSQFIDEFVDWDELHKLEEEEKVKKIKSLNADCIIHVFPNIGVASLAKKAGIKMRVGSSRKFFHLFTCNSFINLKRKNTDLHEAQLNLKLLRFMGARELYSLDEIKDWYGFKKPLVDAHPFISLLDPDKFNLIIHPKSKGSAREWGANNFIKLSELLPLEKFKLFITGTAEEKDKISREITNKTDRFVDLSGKMNLDQLIGFIDKSDGILAASTGPLHIAAALSKNALGIYAPMRPIFPTRWAPIGKNAHFFVLNKNCNACKKSAKCTCIEEINPIDVAQKLNSLYKQKFEQVSK